MSAKNSLKKNFIYNLLYELLVLLVPLITTPYISRIMGANNVGIYNYVTANTTYFTLIAAFGTVSLAQREIASRRDDKSELTREFWGMFVFRLLATLVAVIAFLIFAFLNSEYRVFYIVSGVSILSVAIDISWFFQGIENFRVTVIRNTIVKLFATVLIFLCVKGKSDLLLYISINVGAIFIGNLTLWSFIRKYVDKFSFAYVTLGKHFLGSLKMFIPVVAIQIYTVVDKTMLGMLTDVSEVAYYSQPERIVKMIISIVGALAVVLLPRISRLISVGDFNRAIEYYEKSINFSVLFAMPCMVGMASVADDFVPFFFGVGYEKCVMVLKVLSLLFIILGLARIIGTPLMIPLKRENKYTIAVCSGALINVVLNYFLIARYAAVGAAIATIAAETLVTSLEVYFIRDYFSGKVIMDAVMHYCLPTCVMLIGVLYVQWAMNPGLVRMVISVLVGAVVYCVILLVMRDKIVMDSILLPMIKRVKK